MLLCFRVSCHIKQTKKVVHRRHTQSKRKHKDAVKAYKAFEVNSVAACFLPPETTLFAVCFFLFHFPKYCLISRIRAI